MRKFLLFVFSVFCLNAFSSVITSTASGSWNAASTWSGGVPGAADNVVIAAGTTVTANVNGSCATFTLNGNITGTNNKLLAVSGDMLVNAGGVLDGTASFSMTVGGNFSTASGGKVSLARAIFTVTGLSTVNDTLAFTNATGAKTFNGNFTLSSTGSIYSSAGATIAMNNLIMNPGSFIDGSSTASINAAGTFSVVSGGASSLGKVTMSITSTTQIDGALTIIVNAGTKTLGGNVSISGTGSVYFSSLGTIGMSANLAMSAGSSIDATSSGGNVNVGGTYTAASGGTVTIGAVSFSVTGSSAINGTVSVTNTTGTKTLNGNVSMAATGAFYFTAGETIAMNGNLIMNPGSSVDGTSTGIVSVAGTFSAVTGGTETLGRAALTVTSTSQIDGTVNITSATGAKTLTGDVAMSNGSQLNLSAAGTVSMLGNLGITGTATITSAASGTVSIGGNLNVAGTSVLSTSGTPVLNLSGNWNFSSTASDPFVESTSSVNFLGTTGTQVISTALTQENFYDLTVNNTSAANPGIQTNNNLAVGHTYNHTAGILDLKGKTLVYIKTVTGSATSALSGGKIISSASGSFVSFSDAIDSTAYINFTGTSVGSSSFGVPLTVNTGRINLSSLELYGIGIFTKNAAIDDASSHGGNKFHNDVTLTASTNASRWRFGNGITATNPAKPDTFFGKATFNANANGGSNNNFILGAGSSGNYYADTVKLTSTTIGGLFIGRSNDTKTNSHTFAGHVEVNVTLTGNVTFGESNATLSDSIIFKKTLRLNSSATSTGDIYIGNGQYSTINLTTTAQLIDGTISGATNIYFYKVVQSGTLAQNTTNAGTTNSTIQVGSSTAPCTWNGPITLSAPNINLAYNKFNGSGSSFTMNGLTANQNCTGGNVFGAGSSTTFVNNGSVYWRLNVTAGDTCYGDISFKRSSTGALSPAYAAATYYNGNILIASGSDSVDFAAGGGGVILAGSAPAAFTNSGTKGCSMKSITMNKTGGATFTLNNSIGVPANGSLGLTSGVMNTSSSAYLYLMNWNVTVLPVVTSASTSYINGPMRYDMAVSGSTKNLTFPVGKGSDCRPFILTVQHSSGTSYSYMGEVFNASASNLGYTFPATIDTVSGVHYWDVTRSVTSSGLTDPSTNLAYSAGSYPLIQLYFGANDQVYQGPTLTVVKNTTAAPTTWFDIGGNSGIGYNLSPVAGSVASTFTNTAAPNTAPAAFTSFSRFTLGSKLTGLNPLPVSLLDFSAVPQDQKVNLKWETATETNNSFFTVEKSQDGIKFQKVMDVPGAGNSNSYLEYFETDYQPYNGISYYRLKQTDNNGLYTYSHIVEVNFGKTKSITVYPNPATKISEVGIRATGYKGQVITVLLRDAEGHDVVSKVLYAEEDNSVFMLDDTRTISPGTYIISASSNDKMLNTKLIIR